MMLMVLSVDQLTRKSLKWILVHVWGIVIPRNGGEADGRFCVGELSFVEVASWGV